MIWCLIFLLVAKEATAAPPEYPGYLSPHSKDPYLTNNFYQYPPVHEEHHVGIHVAAWKWSAVGMYFTFTAFIVVAGLAKVAFHHAKWLSSRVPESCLMIIVGVVVGAILYGFGVNDPDDVGKHSKTIIFPKFSPDLFFFVLLPPVILESAYSLYDRSFIDNLSTILMHAVVGTLLNTFMIGPTLYLLLTSGAMGKIEFIPLTDTIVFAALLSAVDPVAVLAIFQEVGVNKDLYYLLFGESLLNDAVTVVLYTTTETFTKMTHIDGAQYGLAFVAFFTVSLGGLSIGIVFGLITALLTKATEDVRIVEPLAVLGTAYLSYLTAELFHFSGIISIIGCGLVQAHYALKNISDESRTTVTYFTKMISSTSDAIIFLFLGMVLVSKTHKWHTGFVLWTLLLCLVCRFIVVFSLTALMNLNRVKKIDFQEQFIMAYGGLRGAVAFSLVKMLKVEYVRSKPLFLTTTLMVILFTVFAQGGTIKLFVNLLNIEKSDSEEKTLLQEINDNILDTMMAGIEEITGVRGDNYLRRKIEYYDQNYLTKIFLNTTKSNSLTRLYEKLSLAQHFAHLYGPVALVEDRKTVLLHVDPKPKLPRSASVRHPAHSREIQDLFPGVQLRRRTISDTTQPDPEELDVSLRTSTEQLRKAFRSNPYQKYHERYDPNLVYDDANIGNMLQRRAMLALRITHEAALTNRSSISPTTEDPATGFGEFFEKPLRKIHSELEGLCPEDVEGIDVLLERARRRVARHSSTAGSYPSYQSHYDGNGLRSVSSDNAPSFPTSVRRTVSLAPRSPRMRKISAGLDSYPESPESQHLIGTQQRQQDTSQDEQLREEPTGDESGK